MLIMCSFLLVDIGFVMSQNTEEINVIASSSSSGESIETSGEPEEEIKTKDYLPDEIDELNEENITTKIYKSSDPSLELIEDNSSLDPSIESDVLTKDELFKKGKGKYKHHKQHKQNKPKFALPSKRQMLPYAILVGLIFLLGILFKFLAKKKL